MQSATLWGVIITDEASNWSYLYNNTVYLVFTYRGATFGLAPAADRRRLRNCGAAWLRRECGTTCRALWSQDTVSMTEVYRVNNTGISIKFWKKILSVCQRDALLKATVWVIYIYIYKSVSLFSNLISMLVCKGSALSHQSIECRSTPCTASIHIHQLILGDSVGSSTQWVGWGLAEGIWSKQWVFICAKQSLTHLDIILKCIYYSVWFSRDIQPSVSPNAPRIYVSTVCARVRCTTMHTATERLTPAAEQMYATVFFLVGAGIDTRE